MTSAQPRCKPQRDARLVNRFLQNTLDLIAANRCVVCFDLSFSIFTFDSSDALDRIHHEVHDKLSHHRDFPTLPVSQCGHPSRSQRPVAAPRCTSSFTTSDTSILDLLACLSLLRLLLVVSQPQFLLVNVCFRRLVPPSLSLFARQPLHLVVTHQHVRVWAPAVLRCITSVACDSS